MLSEPHRRAHRRNLNSQGTTTGRTQEDSLLVFIQYTPILLQPSNLDKQYPAAQQGREVSTFYQADWFDMASQRV